MTRPAGRSSGAADGCNYGRYFTWWDRLMGTEHPQFRERFDEIVVGGEPEPALLRKSRSNG